jgi:hypothetical protein
MEEQQLNPLIIFSNMIQTIEREQNEIQSQYFQYSMPVMDIIMDSMQMERALEASLEEEQPVEKHVISDEGKEELLYLRYPGKEIMNMICDNQECSITQEPFKEEDNIVILPCRHGYMEDNILRWLEEESATCPMCRHKLPSKVIVEKKKLN